MNHDMGLKQNIATESVGQLDIRKPVLCGPNDSVRDAVNAMRTGNLGCVIVIDDDRRPLGMFTESMLVQLLVRDPSALGEPVSKHMAEQCPIASQSDRISFVLEAMETKNVRFIGVVDDDGRVVGLTGQKGLMEYIAEHFPQQVMVQRVGSPPPKEREGA